MADVQGQYGRFAARYLRLTIFLPEFTFCCSKAFTLSHTFYFVECAVLSDRFEWRNPKRQNSRSPMLQNYRVMVLFEYALLCYNLCFLHTILTSECEYDHANIHYDRIEYFFPPFFSVNCFKGSFFFYYYLASSVGQHKFYSGNYCFSEKLWCKGKILTPQADQCSALWTPFSKEISLYVTRNWNKLLIKRNNLIWF